MGPEVARSQESSELERLVDLSADMLCTTGMDGRFLRLNPAWSLALGYSESELVGRQWLEFVHPDDLRRTREHSNALLAPGGEVSNFENRFVHRDGSYRWLSWSARSDGVRVYAVARDMTEQKRAIEALRSSEERFRSIVVASHEGIWTIDADSRTTFVNDRMAEMMGYSPEEMLGRPAFEFLDDEGRALAAPRLEARRRGSSDQGEMKFITKSGTALWTLLSGSPLTNADGEYAGSLAMLADITERRAAEQALRASEERYRSIVETTSEGVWMIDADHRTTYVNPRMAELLGYEVEEMLGRAVAEFTPAERHGGVRRHIESRRDGVADQREELLRHKDGSDVWVLLAGSPITDREGRYAGALAMMADITERKLAEARAAQLAGIVEASPDAIVSLSLDGTIETFNAAAERQSGWTAAEAVGGPVSRMVPPEAAELVPLVLAEVAAGHPVERLITELVHRDGRREEVSMALAPVPGPDGKVSGIACVIRMHAAP